MTKYVVQITCSVNGTYFQGPFDTRAEAMREAAPEPSNCDIRPVTIIRPGTEDEIYILEHS